MQRLILASSSPRRRDLLRQVHLFPHMVDFPELDEKPMDGELPARHALRLAKAKVKAVAPRHTDCFVLAADTVAACGRLILAKTDDVDTARAYLQRLSGRRHRIFSGIALMTPDGRLLARTVITMVAFKRLSASEIDDYLASREWLGKAGGYAIQGLASRYVREIRGSYSNVVGLPIFETINLLAGQGFEQARRITSLRT
jgi:septum formation protein